MTRARRLILSCALVLPTASLAGTGIFGTKSSPIQTADSQTPIGVLPVVQMVIALAVVLAMVKWLLPLAMKKFGNRLPNSGSGMKIQETAAVGPANLAVVTVRGRTFLVGSTSAGVSCLADLTPAEATPTFQEILNAEEEAPKSSLSDLAGQLERLRRIGG